MCNRLGRTRLFFAGHIDAVWELRISWRIEKYIVILTLARTQTTQRSFEWDLKQQDFLFTRNFTPYVQNFDWVFDYDICMVNKLPCIIFMYMVFYNDRPKRKRDIRKKKCAIVIYWRAVNSLQRSFNRKTYGIDIEINIWNLQIKSYIYMSG